MTEFAVESVDALREIYPAPKGTPVKKTLYALDEHCRNFIAHSPILMLGTDGDVSPRGDDPGFVTVADDNTLIIPDRKGNFRVDSMQNILRNSTIGILFLVPGMEVTLRIRGKAAITVDPEILEPLAINGKEPASAIVGPRRRSLSTLRQGIDPCRYLEPRGPHRRWHFSTARPNVRRSHERRPRRDGKALRRAHRRGSGRRRPYRADGRILSR
mgnify:CR=1 FL=1|tara:strand:+ start:625 stop:1266 length:642 start_codon:yes stop_codon:yes gene_type:complete